LSTGRRRTCTQSVFFTIRTAWGCTLLAAIGLMLPVLSGCGRGLQTKPDAAAWKPLEKDPAEDGRDLDRWPGWRGRNGQGIAAGGEPPVHLDLQRGLRWTADVPPGNSSPVVWGQRVFLTAQLDESATPTLGVIALDRRDGRRLWQSTAGPAHGPTHEKNGYASASVATDGERIVAFFGATGLFAFDPEGKRLWRADLGPLSHTWGMAASPVLYHDLVVQLCDNEKDSYLAAFDKSTGQVRWRVARPSAVCWSTPVVVQAPTPSGPRDELIVNGTSNPQETDGWITAYRPADGRELWKVHGTTHLVTPTPLVAGGLVFSLSGRNGPVMALRPGELPKGPEDRVVWKSRRGGPYIPSGVVYRNRLYVLTDPGVLSCYNPGTGQEIWQVRLRGPFTSSLVAAAGRLYAINERGTVYVVAAGDTSRILAESQLGERVLTTPALVGGDLILRTQHRLYCFTGKP
jgi:outer membrane protein assembly factor BamB